MITDPGLLACLDAYRSDRLGGIIHGCDMLADQDGRNFRQALDGDVASGCARPTFVEYLKRTTRFAARNALAHFRS